MAKYFKEELNNAYTVPNQLLVANSKPTDIRQTCNTVKDFEDLAQLGLELRYSGLITHELETGLWKACKKVGNVYTWTVVPIDMNALALKEHEHPEYLPHFAKTQPAPTMPTGSVWFEQI